MLPIRGFSGKIEDGSYVKILIKIYKKYKKKTLKSLKNKYVKHILLMAPTYVLISLRKFIFAQV